MNFDYRKGLKILCFACLALFFFASCGRQKKISGNVDYSFLIQEWNSTITDVMVGDGFSPLLASRAYAYPNIAAYEVLSKGDENSPSLVNRLNGLNQLPQPDNAKKYCYELAAVQAFAAVSKKLVYRENECDELLKKHVAFFRDSLGVDEDVLNRSIEYGNAVGGKIIEWLKADHYAQTKAKPKYLFSEVPGEWIPTPPEFRSALEPYWGTLRTFSGIKPEENSVPFEIPFSKEKGSGFYQLVMEVYDKSKTLTEEEKAIALYWDDNPDQMTFRGHVPTTRRRISPTAHWMGIAGLACKSKKLSLTETSRCYTMVSIAIADALICCWKEKYSTNLVRPVTCIREGIDQEWMPMIATPPFPEHTSGHASVSFSSATVLTEFFGSDFHFTDNSLVQYGEGERSFNSFLEAAEQAGMSRFYAGIHYLTGIRGGQQQGVKAGNRVIDLFNKK